MNLLAVLMGIKSRWDKMPKNEKQAIVDTLDSLGEAILKHRQEAAAAKAESEAEK